MKESIPRMSTSHGEGTYPLPEAQLDRFMFNTIPLLIEEDVAQPTADNGQANAYAALGPALRCWWIPERWYAASEASMQASKNARVIR